MGVDADRYRLLRSPAVPMWFGLLAAALVVHRSHLALDLSGDRLAPLPGLAETWSSYLAEWHPVAGGTAAPAPASLAVVGVLGALSYPFGGPAAGVSILLIGSIPLAGLSAYLASRRIGVPRWARALAATMYALLPVGVQAAVQGRVDGVIVHVLLPVVLSGFVVAPGLPGRGRRRVVALFLVVMLPLGLLMPWPAVVLQHPQVLLHGAGSMGTAVPEPPARLMALDAGMAGPGGWLGAVVAAVALLAVLARPRRAALPGLVLALIGFGAAVVVNTTTAVPMVGGEPRPGWPGPALLVAACGLLWAALGAQAAGSRGGVSTAGSRREVPVGGLRRGVSAGLRRGVPVGGLRGGVLAA